ncbi:MAG: tetratricopeptide repeat protein [Vicinamibacterales bacterium]
MNHSTFGIRALAIIALGCLPAAIVAQGAPPPEQRVTAAERRVNLKPESFEAHNDLALSLTQRARETADTRYYDRAEESVRRSLELSPGNLGAQKMRVWVLLGKHEFAAALEQARALNKQIPDDVQVYGFLTDAHVELGNYKEAEETCQWMLDLRPGNIPALTRAAYLRELFGDIEGAIEFMTAAYQRTSPTEVEERAWFLSQLGHLELIAGRLTDADRVLEEALRVLPDYHYALAGLSKVRLAQGRAGDAVDLLKRRYEAATHPENLYDVAEALVRAGRPSEADVAFAEFEKRALRESQGWDNANRELIFYYSDRAGRPKDALRIARMEVARRQDVYTLNAYAWALHVNNEHQSAQQFIDRALAVGIKDPSILSRARLIAAHDRAAEGATP